MKKIKAFSLLSICFVLLTVFVGCSNDFWSQYERIQELTGVEIPTDTKVIYHYFDDSFVTGRHSQHTVYKFEFEPTDWLTENKFSNVKDTEMEEYFFEFEWNLSKKSGETQKEYIPDFSENYYWLEKSRVYFFYYPDTLKLIVCVPAT